ncbi:MAG: hypothetical protein COA90_06265 [Gammaproteobacteria bacterium]|nr:MAG: hypothetical protein COA90_06265 [Gammaproteobacteria bacterium]
MNIKLLLLLVSILFYGCSESTNDLPRTPEEKLQVIKRLIERNINLPSEIISVNYIEEVQGQGGDLGPTDFKFYLRIEVKPNVIKHWCKGLNRPYNNSTRYSEPKSSQSWWLKESSFSNTMLYETKSYFNSYNGWIYLDKKQGFIYVYTFTT